MNKIKIKDSDYLYATARIRALENGIIGAEKLTQMATAKDIGELSRMFDDAGISSDGGYDEGINARCADAFALAKSMSGCDVFDILRYPYDAHNLKSIVKCDVVGTSPAHLLVGLGTVSVQAAEKAGETRDFSAFPSDMAAAATEAFDIYSKTSDPQKIDTVIDKACYADMNSKLSEYDFDFLKTLVKVKIDLTNILTTVRLIRMKSNYVNEGFLADNLIENGNIAHSVFLSLFEKGEDEFFAFLAKSEYSALAQYGTLCPLSTLERACDDEYMIYVKDNTKYLSYGAPVLCAYVIAREYEGKNLRILLASKEAELPSDKITERLRASYV